MLNWQTVKEYEDITYRKAEGVARIFFNRPARRNAFRPRPIAETIAAFATVLEDSEVGVVILTWDG